MFNLKISKIKWRPFIVYADIESLLVPVTEVDDDDDRDSDGGILSKRKKSALPKGATKKHIPNKVGYYFLSRIDSIESHYDTFIGPDCIERFI